MWLCTKCFHIHVYRKACTSKLHQSEVIAGPFNGHGADFLIHGVLRLPAGDLPHNDSTHDYASEYSAEIGLTLELLDMVFQRRITTVSSIPPSCRLFFSRTLKSALDTVITSPGDIHAWLQLSLLPTYTLDLYIPKCSSDGRSGTRKKLQIAEINQSLNA